MSHQDRKIRRSQLIYPFGIGAIVPFDVDLSLIVGGIDSWKTPDENEIKDQRLCRFLHVDKLFWPPHYDENSGGAKSSVPAYRFPNLYYCSKCGYVDLLDRSDDLSPMICHACQDQKGTKESGKMIPERFVVICEQGHISDFPVAEFLHSKGVDIDPAQWNSRSREGRIYRFSHRIYRHTSKKSSSLSDISFSLGDYKGVPRYSLSGITMKGALKDILPTCRGERPWLNKRSDGCNIPGSELMVVQRGGSNVWFPQMATSIFLPSSENGEFSKELVDFVTSHASGLDKFYTANKKITDEVVALAGFSGVEVTKCFEKLILKKAGGVSAESDESEMDFRYEEYQKLCVNYGSDEEDIYVKSVPIAQYDDSIKPYFEEISLVEKLKETTAFYGFSRMAPRTDPINVFKKTLSNDPKNWLPAIQNQGEGIFLQFNAARVAKWAKNSEIIQRAKRVEKYRQKATFYNASEDFCVTPEFLLIHTFSHLLINQLSKSCGYGSSSLKERLYISTESGKEMLGVLIYTSSSSSEGSLGGLVKEGKPGHLEDIINDALEGARWCSSDPVCIESDGQGPDSCNLAACFNCALLPETCCERGNKYLDRVCVIGKLDDQSLAYFAK